MTNSKDRKAVPSNLINVKPEELAKQVADRIPNFILEGEPEQLTGGYLNYVWRIRNGTDTKPHTLIVKWAPPYVATSPGIPLDPERIILEAKIYSEFNPGNKLSGLGNDQIRPPRLVLLDEAAHLIVMEDVCDCPDLGICLLRMRSVDESYTIGSLIGDFIGRLHKFSAHHPELAKEFDNSNIQRTRLEVLYKNVTTYGKRAGIQDYQKIGRIAVNYGNLLQETGEALIMGDLWPPSILVEDMMVRIIDWELTHFGRPSQDIGHFTAHLWMQLQQTNSPIKTKNTEATLRGFLNSYRSALGDQFIQIFGVEGVKESSIHFGCEILARTVGLFQNGYVYDGYDPESEVIRKATDHAAKHIRDPLKMQTFDELGWREE